MQKGALDDERAFAALYTVMKTEGADFGQVEDLLWKLSKHYQEKARFYSNMRQDILFAFDKVEN
jgi:hypothetical protein